MIEVGVVVVVCWSLDCVVSNRVIRRYNRGHERENYNLHFDVWSPAIKENGSFHMFPFRKKLQTVGYKVVNFKEKKFTFMDFFI